MLSIDAGIASVWLQDSMQLENLPMFFWQEQMKKVREEKEAVAVAAWFLTCVLVGTPPQAWPADRGEDFNDFQLVNVK